MSHTRLFTRTTREAPAASLSKSVIAPTLLPVCCCCRKIRDETGSSPDREHWVTQRMYRKTHGVNPTTLALTHTYCLPCFTKFMDTLRQYRQEIGSAP